MQYSVNPRESELRKARSVVERGLESCRYIIEKDKDFQVDLGWIEREGAGSEMFPGAHGTARDPTTIQLFFNTQVDGWEDSLESITKYAYAESLFYELAEYRGLKFTWQHILKKAFAQHFLDSEKSISSAEREKARREWQEIDLSSSEEYMPDISWQLCYLVGEDLLKNLELSQLPTLERSDVEKAGDSI